MPDEFDQYIEKPQADEWDQYKEKPATAPKAEQPKPTFLSNVGLTEGPDVPLTDYPHASLSGVQSIGRGIRGAGEGLYNTFRHPIDTVKNLAAIPAQAAQVPAALRDINSSNDPTGFYAKAAQETAGQGAGQALTSLATEGAGRAVASVPKSVSTSPVRFAARSAEGVANSSPARYLRSAFRTFAPADEARSMVRVPGRDFGLTKPTYPGAMLPEKPPTPIMQARGLANGGYAPVEQSEALARIPVTAAEPDALAIRPRGKLGGRLVLTPEEAQQAEKIQEIAKRRASERGMQYAGGMRPSGGKVATP